MYIPRPVSSVPLHCSSSSGPSHLNLEQGDLGDCFLISALGSIADASPQAIRDMFIDNGDGTYTVRFFTASGTADYVTVNTALVKASYENFWDQATHKNHINPLGLTYERLGVGNSLWLPLAEKAYAEWAETGNVATGKANAYSSIQGGCDGDVYNQVLDAYGRTQTAEWGDICIVVSAGQTTPSPAPNEGSEAQLSAAWPLAMP